MNLSWILATLHLLALGLGLGAILTRGRVLRRLDHGASLQTAFWADSWWGVAAVLWLGTGVWRAFGGVEKGTAYYMTNGLFHAKIGIFVLILLLEIWPMLTLMRWRRQLRNSVGIDASAARPMAVISHIQFVLVIVLIFLGTAISRGIGAN